MKTPQLSNFLIHTPCGNRGITAPFRHYQPSLKRIIGFKP
jgi:hypothetical protein